jgi:hypothetical protein
MARGSTGSQRMLWAAVLVIAAGGARAAATPEADFSARCAAGGVLVCQGFDNVSKVSVSGEDGLYPVLGSSTFRGFSDTSIKTSGGGSLRFDIPSGSGDDPAGHWEQAFKKSFAQKSTFYVQFRQRFDTNFVSFNWGKTGQGTSPKQAVFYDGNATPCDNVELTTVDYYSTGAPIIYSECGNNAAFGDPNNIGSYGGKTGTLQQGASKTSGYNCVQDQTKAGTGNGSGCFLYTADKWVTFYYQIDIGSWGQANSSIQAWVSIDGGPYVQWVNVKNYTLRSGSGSSYNRVMLTPYMTGKNASVDHPLAHTWYDELIVSTQPIAAPGGAAAPQTVVPNPPTDVVVE